MAMSTFFDVRFKFPWNLHGYSRHDRIAFGQLTGYKHFFIGVNPDRTFHYLRIHDESGRVKMESELSNISYAGLEALILWRLSTPMPVLNSMAMACLGLKSAKFQDAVVPKTFRTDMPDANFTLDLAKFPLKDFAEGNICLMLVEQYSDRDKTSDPLRRELLLYTHTPK